MLPDALPAVPSGMPLRAPSVYLGATRFLSRNGMPAFASCDAGHMGSQREWSSIGITERDEVNVKTCRSQ
jgi:hypothetical protein